VLAVVAALVSVAGIPYAIVRLIRTDATVRATEEHLSRYQTLTLLPVLLQREENLEAAILANDRDATIRAVGEWKATAGRLRGIMAAQGPDDELLATLQKSLLAATTAKGALIDKPTVSVTDATTRLRSAVSVVTSRSIALEAELASTSKKRRSK
jgi:hypothetical protein